MRSALSERPVKGTSAGVCEVDEAKLTLEVNKIDGFSKLHNVQIDEKTIRVWKSYRIGRGKEISFDQLVTKDQGDTCLIVKEEFFPFHNSRVYQSRDSVAEDSDEGNRHHDLDNSDIEIFECSEPGCVKSFQLFSELEAHLDVGDHCVEAERQSETLYDTIRRDWVERFTTTVNITENEPCEPVHQSESEPAPTTSCVIMGWALTKQRAGSTRFPEKVKNYLMAKFDLGEQSGLKADPQQYSNDMRKARDEQNRRLFEREEWLTKSQVQGFFSRLSANRRRKQAPSPEGEQSSKELFLEEEEEERQRLMEHISEELRPQHPLSYDAFNLCECAKKNKLHQFNVTLLKDILRHYEVPFKSRDRRKDLIDLLMLFVQECKCFN
ncbi:uncharacterized protein [Montipora foliosa]|uniref:uncharacterized protein n=1 Tax=Montipora foliosa TaxID=591990 RepID=UPI0035F1D0DC